MFTQDSFRFEYDMRIEKSKSFDGILAFFARFGSDNIKNNRI